MNLHCIAFTELRNTSPGWRSVLHLGKCVNLRKSARILHHEELYYLEKGQVRLTHYTADGQEKTLWYIGEGCIFGEAPFFDPMPQGRGFHVCTRSCVVYMFTKDCVRQKIAPHYPELMEELLQSLARKVRLLSNHASSLYVDDVLIRICKFLGERLIAGSTPLRARPGLSRLELANLLGVHRITLYKALRQQEELGLWGPYNRASLIIYQQDNFFSLVNA